VWKASGHLAGFADPLMDCKSCKTRHRADQLIEDYTARKKKTFGCAGKSNAELEAYIKEQTIGCPHCGKSEFTNIKQFNLMFKTFIGPLDDTSSTIYLRPESAQGIFVNFKNVMETSRQKVPFGIAQIGKAFRNEINTKNFLFRTREFEQMEMQYFIKPHSEKEWFEYWQQERWNWYVKYGMKPEKMKFKVHEKLAHYANYAVDIEFEFPFGFGEIEGIHSRTDFDLMAHQNLSGKKLEYVDTVSKERFVPYVIETSGGVSRGLMAFLCNAYDEEEPTNSSNSNAAENAEKRDDEKRVVMRFHPNLAPVQVAVFPLVNKDGMPEKAHSLYKDLQKNFKTQYDVSAAIGRRYRRQDEIGTPYCITVDGETLANETVTVRERDSMQQETINIEKVREYLFEKFTV
jgi:glycyl-tRNA synthetase